MPCYIFGIDCQTTLQVQEKLIYKSLACRNLCTIILLLLRPDTGPAVQILGNIGALQKYKFCDGNKGKKVQLSFVILRTKLIFSGPNFRALATNKGKSL